MGPAVAWEMTFVEHYRQFGFEEGGPEHQGYAAELEATKDSVKRMREAGMRVLIGGDYGLNITPHGSYAKELEYFTRDFGFSPAEALQAATKHGGEAFMPGGNLGTLEPGQLADMVIVNGNPLEDITVLQNPDNIPVCDQGWTNLCRAVALAVSLPAISRRPWQVARRLSVQGIRWGVGAPLLAPDVYLLARGEVKTRRDARR